MSLADVVEEDYFPEVDRELRRLIDKNSAMAVGYYASLNQKLRYLVQKQDYWHLLDEKIELMAYGQI